MGLWNGVMHHNGITAGRHGMFTIERKITQIVHYVNSMKQQINAANFVVAMALTIISILTAMHFVLSYQ